MFDRPVVFLDVETTGATTSLDRITEVGFVEVNAGELVEEWSTLVNPGQPIPSAIEALTGITNAMVAGAPSFEKVSAELYHRLEGKLLVAHNARFDYGFLRHEFARVGLRYQASVLCTVKLSRRLYPQERRHNLDSLIARHGLECGQRHRALADARVLWDFTRRIRLEFGDDAVLAAVAKVLRTDALPPGLDPGLIDTLPEGPGVYVFHGADDAPLYVGKGVDIRTRVLSHFSGERRAAKDLRITRDVTRVAWHETAGELGALLREARLVKQLMPIGNRTSRAQEDLCAFHWNPAGSAPPKLMSAPDIDFRMASDLYGLFASRSRANRALRGIADANGLCPRLLGLEGGGSGPCFSYQARKCRGACCGKETVLSHNLRLANALHRLRLEPWPFNGRIGVRETDPVSGRSEVHLLDRWCYLDTVDSQADLCDAAETRFDAAFDLDIYQVLSKWLLRRRHDVEIVELPARH